MIDLNKEIRIDDKYIPFNGEWANYLINLGIHITSHKTNASSDSKYVLLTPIDDLVPELIAVGALKGRLKKANNTGFYKLDSVIDHLVNVEKGTVLTIIEKIHDLKPYQGKLIEVNSDQLLIDRLDKENDIRGWKRDADIEISLLDTENKTEIKSSLKSDKSLDINFQFLQKIYPEVNPVNLLSLSENYIQIIGNKNHLEERCKLEVKIDDVKGCFDEALLSSAIKKNNKTITNIVSSDSIDKFYNNADLSLFVQTKNKDISQALYWSNSKPKVVIIPRSSPQVTELVPRLNKEYYKSEDEVSLPQNCDECIENKVITPKSCEIMGYI
tara:strand:+ start:317 stop:1300 length:984 start_codon:yes stop_codon:yes gene_type:complete